MKRLVLAGALLPVLFAGALSAADTINAAGASFPAPIYQKWFEEFKAKTGVNVRLATGNPLLEVFVPDTFGSLTRRDCVAGENSLNSLSYQHRATARTGKFGIPRS